MLDGITTPKEAINQVDTIFTNYIKDNENNYSFLSWVTLARTAQGDFNTKILIEANHNFDDLKSYTLELADRFIVTTKSTLGYEGNSKLRKSLIDAAFSWPTQWLYLQLEEMKKKISSLEEKSEKFLGSFNSLLETATHQTNDKNLETLQTKIKGLEKKLEESDLCQRLTKIKFQENEAALRSETAKCQVAFTTGQNSEAKLRSINQGCLEKIKELQDEVKRLNGRLQEHEQDAKKANGRGKRAVKQ